MIELHSFVFTFADLSGRVILRWRGQRDKHPHVTNAGRVAFNPGDSVHQFHTPYFRVRNTPHYLTDEVDTFAGDFVFQLAGFQVFEISQAARVHIADRHFACVR